jgi:hypothetical protein
MGLFKSREEKKIERDIEIRKGIASLKRNIKDLMKHQLSYVEKAKRAMKIGDKEQLEFLKRMLKKTAAQKRMREKQLLSIETAVQLKDQAESDGDFARSMGSVAKSISEVYGSVDFVKTQKNFEKAMMQAETLQQQMDVFLQMTSESVMSGEIEGEDEVISDSEIDRMLNEQVTREESGGVDKDIAKGLKEIQDELDKQDK